MNAITRIVVLALGSLVFGTSAFAASCAVSTGSVAFGSYSPLSGGSRDSTGNVYLSCSDALTSVVSYTIGLSAGAGSFASRSMLSGVNTLAYNLFKDSARTLTWGDGTGGSTLLEDSYTMTSSPTARTYPIYGRIPGGQIHARVGMYADAIVVTVAF